MCVCVLACVCARLYVCVFERSSVCLSFSQSLCGGVCAYLGARESYIFWVCLFLCVFVFCFMVFDDSDDICVFM